MFGGVKKNVYLCTIKSNKNNMEEIKSKYNNFEYGIQEKKVVIRGLICVMN